MDTEDIRVLQEENTKLKLVIKELAQLTGNFDNEKAFEDFRLYTTGCGCCSESIGYNSALEDEIAQSNWRIVSAVTVQTCWEILNAG